MNNVCEPISESQVSTQLYHLEKTLESILQLINQLDDRLAPVLTRFGKLGAGSDIPNPPEPVLVPLADRIRNSINVGSDIEGSIREFLENIEL